MKKGIIFNIQRFSINDGPGIRTTVFFKGCPAGCLWCHNPESIDARREISYIPGKCVLCGECARICPSGCHITGKRKHVYNRKKCTRCGKCAPVCSGGALEIIGRKMSPDEVAQEVLKDRTFFAESGGGVTLSGGEPLMQAEFAGELLRLFKEKKLHTCLDTSGIGPFGRIERLSGLVDIFLYDLKETDTERHRKYTGTELEPILENLRKLDRAGSEIILSCPVIPGVNDRKRHFKEIAVIAENLKNIREIDLQPYHPMGVSKNIRIGRRNPASFGGFPEEKEIDGWIKTLRSFTSIPVKRR